MPRRPAPRNDQLAAVILEQQIALASKHGLDRSAEHSKEARQKHPDAHLRFLDIDRRLNRVAKRRHLEVELVSRPPRFDMRSARNMLVEPMNIIGDPAAGLVLAEVVRKIDFDWL